MAFVVTYSYMLTFSQLYCNFQFLLNWLTLLFTDLLYEKRTLDIAGADVCSR